MRSRVSPEFQMQSEAPLSDLYDDPNDKHGEFTPYPHQNIQQGYRQQRPRPNQNQQRNSSNGDSSHNHNNSHPNNLSSSNNSNALHDIDQLRNMYSKLRDELDQIKTRIDEVTTGLEQVRLQQQQNQPAPSSGGVLNERRTKNQAGAGATKPRPLRKKDSASTNKQDSVSDAQAAVSTTNAANPESTSTVARTNLPHARDRRNSERVRLNKRDYNKDRLDNQQSKPLPPTKPNDDSTTQAADPSSEDKVDGEDGQRGERGVRRVLRRRKQPYKKGGQYRRRRRLDSSERNSNDTSPQNEVNGDDYRPRHARLGHGKENVRPKKTYAELNENQLNEVVQVLKRDFLVAEIGPVRKTINEKGPVVAQEFASAILDHAMCDVTSPTKLSEIANNIYHILISDEGGYEFQQGFYLALSDISKREDDIAIDAPRYMDTLGQVLGQCLVPMNTKSHKQLLRRFLNKCLQSYVQQSRALLLASIMKGIANSKSDRFAKDVWDTANLKWENVLNEGTELADFLESQDVKFTTQTFSPEPVKAKRSSEELEKFADDVTQLVEKGCTMQTLEEVVRDLELETEEQVEFMGTLIYAIVRGCLLTDSGEYKLNSEALTKYSNILKNKVVDGQPTWKKEQLDAIALNALTALTKLWHQYSYPQNLMSTILLAMHNHGIASYDALKTWLDSEDLKMVPGIGAARLSSKRWIEDLGVSRQNNNNSA